ncbi:hypothetical protein [Candidatus Wolbachia massiliensis]|uniref:Uncharacterized protein n=1 Tax=Candidatus Wolbachia massiliensis TaxID=1845000 RepID=A0A7L7YRW5_9RICK|nr:hypothetical protein [Candidatus Wolbachia massiliensis]QOD38051.1 hypothetical protein ID128_04450 [Candidatus Wolbachia massiliensis]
MLKKKSDTLAQKVRTAYRHDFRKIVCITTSLTALLCKISLQFCCEFIDNNRSNIYFIRDIARWVKSPMSILYIAYSAFILYDLIKDYRDPKGKKELVKIVGKSASLVSSIIETLMILKIIQLLTKNNADVISSIYLTSTILFLFISEPISYYYTCKKYQEAHKKCQDTKDTNELAECEKELAKCKKALVISTLTLSLGLLNFVLRRIEIATIPINLGNGVIYNFNLSVTVSIIYSAVFLFVQLDKLFNQPVNGDPPSQLDGTYHDHNHDQNGQVMEV